MLLGSRKSTRIIYIYTIFEMELPSLYLFSKVPSFGGPSLPCVKTLLVDSGLEQYWWKRYDKTKLSLSNFKAIHKKCVHHDQKIP